MCGFLLALIEHERSMGFICISPVFVARNTTPQMEFLSLENPARQHGM
jgi:hypothetical protein